MAEEIFLRPRGGLLGASRRLEGYRRATEMPPKAAGRLREATEGYGGVPKATEGYRNATDELPESCRRVAEGSARQSDTKSSPCKAVVLCVAWVCGSLKWSSPRPR